MRDRQWTIRLIALAALVAGAVVLWRWWTRPPALEFDNLKYLQLLTTAVSARNAEWLDRVGTAVAQQHQAGAMTDVEIDALRRIIAIADAGDWHLAHVECHALAEAQLSRRRSRAPTSGHDHQH